MAAWTALCDCVVDLAVRRSMLCPDKGNVAICADSGSMIFSVLLHTMEDRDILKKSMEGVMKCCVQRIHRNEVKSGYLPRSQRQQTQIALKTFLEMLSPLLYRNQSIFMEVFRENIRVTRPSDSSNLIVSLKESTSICEKGADHAADSVEGASEAVPAQPHTTPSSSDRPVVTTLTPSSQRIVQSVVDNLLVLICQQWTRFRLAQRESPDAQVVGCNQKSRPPAVLLDESAYMIKLSLADLLVIVADLVSSVPGLATCIHKFNLTSSMERLPTTCHGVLRYCLEDMTHAVTGEALHSSYFVTFLVHYLIMAASLCASSDKSAKHTPPREDTLPVGTRDEEKESTIAGKSFGEAPAYLLATLLARPGDGRRRCLKEIVSAFKLQHHTLDSTSKLQAVSVLASITNDYHTPKASWRRSEMLVLPTKEIHSMMASMKFHTVLSEALCAVSLEHPLALDVSLALAVPLDAMIRRKAHENSERGTDQASPEPSSSSSLSVSAAAATPSTSRPAMPTAPTSHEMDVQDTAERSGEEGRVTASGLRVRSMSDQHSENETDTQRLLNDSLPIEDHSSEYATAGNQSFQDDFHHVHNLSDGEDEDAEHDDDDEDEDMDIDDDDDDDDDDEGEEEEDDDDDDDDEDEDDEDGEDEPAFQGVLHELPEELRNIVTAASDRILGREMGVAEDGEDDDDEEFGAGPGEYGQHLGGGELSGDEEDDDEEGGDSTGLDIENFVSANDEQISAVSSGVDDDDDAEDDYVMADPDAVEINWDHEDDDDFYDAVRSDMRK